MDENDNGLGGNFIMSLPVAYTLALAICTVAGIMVPELRDTVLHVGMFSMTIVEAFATPGLVEMIPLLAIFVARNIRGCIGNKCLSARSINNLRKKRRL
jgi:hypothetical protein